jgi:hypothetical protein
MNDIAPLDLEYVSPFQISMATAISRYKLENLIKAGLVKAKRIDAQTVLIEVASIRRYINELPDVAPDVADESEAPSAPKEVTLDKAMKNDMRRKALDDV